MSADAEDAAAVEAGPEPVEHARHAVFNTPDGGMVIARAGPLCERCASCGCGEQADPIVIPPVAVTAWRAMQNGDRVGALAKMKAMMSRG